MTEIPLFERFPALRGGAPRQPLGLFPTPLEPVAGFEGARSRVVFLKRDDVAGGPYGGNKVRKLEFLLAEALRRGAREVVTVGFAGSNHVVATAVYARAMGLACRAVLIEQPWTDRIGANLRRAAGEGACLTLYPNVPAAAAGVAAALAASAARHRRRPFFVPAGGSSPLGDLGYANAAMEILAQYAPHGLPGPDLVYVPFASMGTVAGLALGFRAAGAAARVVAVRVAPERFANAARLRRQFALAARLVRRHVPSFPELELRPEDVEIRHEFFGPGYAVATQEGRRAAEVFAETAGLALDQTYSAKAAAAFLHDLRSGRPGEALFVATYNSRDMADVLADRLPPGLAHYE